MRRSIWTGDNMEMLSSITTASTALVYMDPPFASNRDYDYIQSTSRKEGAERVSAFKDTWSFSSAANLSNPQAAKFIDFLAASQGHSRLAEYLGMMTERLIESHRILSASGSIFVHCDSSASHYLKVILDLIFGVENFRNEIIWKRTHAHSSAKRFGPVHDTIYFYTKSSAYKWNPPFVDYGQDYVSKHFRLHDDHGYYQLITCTAPGDRTGTRAHYEWNGMLPPPGRHWAWKIEKMEELAASGLLVHSSNGVPRLKKYLHEGAGLAVQDVWTDIARLDAHSSERSGYDTQKPLALLRRIIEATTDPGDLVVDPFCGSGTTAVAAEELGRSWLVGDVSLLATSITLGRVRQVANKAPVVLRGTPSTKAAALQLKKGSISHYGAWAAGMLGTVTDRSDPRLSLISGTGRLTTIAGKAVDIASWITVAVDFSSNHAPRSNRRRLPSLGFVLDDGHEGRYLLRQMKLSMPSLPMVAVKLDDLVELRNTRTGIASSVIESVEAHHPNGVM